jgi:hypothetical protein
MDELRHARQRVVYKVLKHLEDELPRILRQMSEVN